MYDLLVKNGLVASEYTVLPLDVAVQYEKVVALASHGALDAIGAKHVIDATGWCTRPLREGVAELEIRSSSREGAEDRGFFSSQ